MDRKDFLEGLRSYLEPEVSAQVVQENIYYYERYITEEVVKGRREEEIVEELGDPWVLAKTIIDMEEARNNSDTVYESEKDNVYNEKRMNNQKMNSFWKKAGIILAIVGIIVLIFSFITGLISLLSPILLPILIFAAIRHLIFGKRRY